MATSLYGTVPSEAARSVPGCVLASFAFVSMLCIATYLQVSVFVSWRQRGMLMYQVDVAVKDHVHLRPIQGSHDLHNAQILTGMERGNGPHGCFGALCNSHL